MTNEFDNYKVCKDEVKDYLESANLLYNAMEVDDNGLPTVIQFACPFSMLCCLTIELEIKNILVKNNVLFKHEHKLVDLFNLLPENMKKQIYEHRNANWIPPFGDDKQAAKNFNELLENENNNFIDMRYFFENKRKSVTTTVSFIHTLSNILFELF